MMVGFPGFRRGLGRGGHSGPAISLRGTFGLVGCMLPLLAVLMLLAAWGGGAYLESRGAAKRRAEWEEMERLATGWSESVARMKRDGETVEPQWRNQGEYMMSKAEVLRGKVAGDETRMAWRNRLAWILGLYYLVLGMYAIRRFFILRDPPHSLCRKFLLVYALGLPGIVFMTYDVSLGLLVVFLLAPMPLVGHVASTSFRE